MRMLALILCISTACCENQISNYSKPIIAGEPLDQVFLRVKQEVGVYQNDSAAWHNNLASNLQKLGVDKIECGTGDINFLIKNVKLEFSATLDETDKANIGLKVPFAPTAGGNFSLGYSASLENKNTEDLTYTYYVPPHPAIDRRFIDTIGERAVLLPTLTALRNSLEKAAAQSPCMSDTPNDKDDTFSFSVELTRDSNPSVGFNFAILSAGTNSERNGKHGNTITVTFHPTRTGGQIF